MENNNVSIDDNTHLMPHLANAPHELQMAALKAIASREGMRLPNTILPENTALLPSGEEYKRKLQGDIAKLPDLVPGLLAARASIQAEDHRDARVDIQRVRMVPTFGGLYGQGQDASKALGYTQSGFSHVLQFIKPKSVRNTPAELFQTLPPKIGADVFNHWAETARKVDGQVIMRTIKDARNAKRIIRAVTSERHSQETGDDLAIMADLESMVPAGAKLRFTRTMDRTDIEIIWPAMERQLRVGDIALICLSIRNSETKAGSLLTQVKLLRVLCYNFTTAYSNGGDEEITLRHVGDLRLKLPAAIRRALAKAEPFVRAFGDAYKVSLPENAPTRGELLARIGKVFKVELPSGALDLAGQLWDRDGDKSAGDTLAGVVNALTRASQEYNMETASSIENVAGRLIVNGWDALN